MLQLAQRERVHLADVQSQLLPSTLQKPRAVLRLGTHHTSYIFV